MNCKPGDMVVVIKDIPTICTSCGGPATIKVAGHINRVVLLVEDNKWLFEEPYLGALIESPCNSRWRVSFFGMDDSHLRPLDDKPGQDESLLWKPVPTKETTS